MSDPRKAQQWKIVGLAGAGCVTLLGILGWVMNASEANLVGTSDSPAIDPTIIADVTSSASPELSWISQSKVEIEKHIYRLSSLLCKIFRYGVASPLFDELSQKKQAMQDIH